MAAYDLNYWATLGLLEDSPTAKPDINFVGLFGVFADIAEGDVVPVYPSSLTPVTVGEVTTSAQYILGYDPSKDSTNFVTVSNIMNWVNEAVKKISTEGRVYERSCFLTYTGPTTIDVVTGFKHLDNIDTSYGDVVDVVGIAFTSALSSPLSSAYLGDYKALDRIRMDKYGRAMGGESVTNEPPKWFGFMGQGNVITANDSIYVYPKVTLSAGKYMYALIFYYGCPQTWLTSGVALQIPVKWHHAILDYVLGQARKKLNQPTLAMQHLTSFDNFLKWAKMEQSCSFFGRSLEDKAWP
jgi:hypothetical protein